MDKALAGLIGAVGALAVATPGQAAPGQAAAGGSPNLQEVMRAESYADLLKPIPNAAAVLQASDEAERQEAERQAEPGVMEVQYYYHHHHHHHHHRFYRPRFVRPFFPPRYVRHHHHHHHHHHGPLLIIR